MTEPEQKTIAAETTPVKHPAEKPFVPSGNSAKYQEENNKLLNSFFGRTFFKGWKDHSLKECENFRSLEIFYNDKCNLACTYCYLYHSGAELYPQKIQDRGEISKNIRMFLDWMNENDYVPHHIELFSGEVFVQDGAREVLHMLLDNWAGKEKKPEVIVVPTNFTFLLSDPLTGKVEELLEKSRSVGIPIGLSASFDGKYCEANRPFKNGRELRDDAYYDKAFTFAKKWGTGFHPMVYSHHIEDWKKNWLWFQENFQKHRLPWKNIYLLEVRNVEWTSEQMKNLGEFIEFLIKWTFQYPCGNDPDAFIKFLFDGGYNILRNPLTTIGRGLGCSIQSAFVLRAGDLSIVPCHRTSYDPLLYGKMKVEEGQITGIEAKNVDLMDAVYSFDASTQPYCEQCLLKPLCSFGCLGSQLEVTGDLFTPIPTVCELEHVKIGAMIKAYKDIGVWERILSRVTAQKRYSLRRMEKMMYGTAPETDF